MGTDLKLGFLWWEASLLNGGVKGGMPEGKRMPEREGNEPGGAEVAVFTLPTFIPTSIMIAASPWCSIPNDGLPSALG